MEILRLITYSFRIINVTDSEGTILHVILRNDFKTSWETDFTHFSLLMGTLTQNMTSSKYQKPLMQKSVEISYS